MESDKKTQRSTTPDLNTQEYIRNSLSAALVMYLMEKEDRQAILEWLEGARPDDVNFQLAIQDLRKAANLADRLKKEFLYQNHQGA